MSVALAPIWRRPNGPCATGSSPVPSVYAAQTTRKTRLPLRTKRFARYLIGGG